MIGAARVMAAVHAPRMDAVGIKRGILSVDSLSGLRPFQKRFGSGRPRSMVPLLAGHRFQGK